MDPEILDRKAGWVTFGLPRDMVLGRIIVCWCCGKDAAQVFVDDQSLLSAVFGSLAAFRACVSCCLRPSCDFRSLICVCGVFEDSVELDPSTFTLYPNSKCLQVSTYPVVVT